MPSSDPRPSPSPKPDLSRLRDIGWSIWDPICLLDPSQDWRDEECKYFADEYDSYMIQAAGQLRRGVSQSDVVRYLVQIETEHMGLGPGRNVLERAAQVVAAIQADKDLWT